MFFDGDDNVETDFGKRRLLLSRLLLADIGARADIGRGGGGSGDGAGGPEGGNCLDGGALLVVIGTALLAIFLDFDFFLLCL